MSKILVFFSDDMADFEITLALHGLKAIGKKDVVTVARERIPLVSQSGFTYLPDLTLAQAFDLDDVEALIIPGGPIRPQPEGLSELIQKLDGEGKLLAAICFGPQYLGRAGVLDQHRFTTSCSQDHIRSIQVPDPYPRQNFVDERVVRDGNVITAKGRAFVDFAFAIYAYLGVQGGRDDYMEDYQSEIMDRRPETQV